MTRPRTLEACAANARSRIGRTWLDWLLPPRCGSCRSLGSWLCDRCRARVRWLREPLCPRCGRELEFAGRDCACRRRLRWLARATAAAAYEGPLEQAIHRFKYEGWRVLAPTLADLVLDRLAGDLPASPLVVAVPLHRRRLRTRGYNQSELLAAEVRARLRLPSPPGRLVRLRDTPPQVGSDRLHRLANVAGAFAWRGSSPAGRPFVVVDDVATTGATLEACAAALRAAGSGPVVGVTIARVSV
ncbi:MAG TPA: ComF family protein [Candidatus Dormibacteraeota bacterium]|nr:ComF family protein [Candidatus Dormibacteraeota bacterium]